MTIIHATTRDDLTDAVEDMFAYAVAADLPCIVSRLRIGSQGGSLWLKNNQHRIIIKIHGEELFKTCSDFQHGLTNRLLDTGLPVRCNHQAAASIWIQGLCYHIRVADEHEKILAMVRYGGTLTRPPIKFDNEIPW